MQTPKPDFCDSHRLRGAKAGTELFKDTPGTGEVQI